ncbi:MAG: subclass B3 metallo-beta-lactamase [Chitinophagaceae bacterium]|nr:MAG: subclass B3 metallo-beta-lactamase [Chitinophagaceae bacterium]
MKNLKSAFILLLFITTLITIPGFGQRIAEPKSPETWKRSYEPFRIAGNLYYVGTYDLAAYLITTEKGNILINTGLASSALQIRKSIEQLGFRYSDLKILLTTQAHYDHVAAMATIRKQTGAKVYVDEGDADVLLSGGSTDYEMGKYGMTFAPVRADKILHHKDTVSLGTTKLVMLHHPGHTKGSCSFLIDVKDSAKSYRVLIANLPSIITEKKFDDIPAYPRITKDYAFTFSEMKAVQFDLWVASHASQFDMHEKHKPGDAYNPSVFADRKLYDDNIKELEDAFKNKTKNTYRF